MIEQHRYKMEGDFQMEGAKNWNPFESIFVLYKGTVRSWVSTDDWNTQFETLMAILYAR